MERTGGAARRADGADDDGERDAAAEAPSAEAPRMAIRSEASCPLCLDALTTQPRLDVCPTCKTIQHTACVAEFGRCATIGCEGLVERTPSPDDPRESTPPPGYRRPPRPAGQDLLEQVWSALGVHPASRTRRPIALPRPTSRYQPPRVEHRGVERLLVVLAFLGALAVPIAIVLYLVFGDTSPRW